MLFRSALCCLLLYFGSCVRAQTPQLVVPVGHTKDILALRTAPGGGLLASTSIDETVKVWDAASGRELHTLRPGTLVRDLDFTADERTLALAAFSRLQLVDTRTWRVRREIRGWNVYGVRTHPTRNEVYYLTQRPSSTGEDPIQLYAVALPDGQPRRIASVPVEQAGQVASLDLSPDGRQLLLGHGGSQHLVDVSTGRVTPAPAGARRFTPDGNLFVAREAGGTAIFGVRTPGGQTRWELSTGAAEITNYRLRNSMDFDPAGGARFYWSNAAGRIAHGSYPSGQPSMYEMPPTLGAALAVGATGEAYVATDDYRINVYRLPKMTLERTLGERVLAPQQVAGSGGGGRSRLSWGRTRISTLELAGRQLLPYGGPVGDFYGRLRYSANGELLAAASTDLRDVFSYHNPTNADGGYRRFKAEQRHTLETAPSADGKRLLVVSHDGLLFLNSDSHKQAGKIGLLPGQAYYREHAALSPAGGRALVTTAQQRPDGRTENREHLLEWPTGRVLWSSQHGLSAPTFSTDGGTVYGEVFQHFVAIDANDGRITRRHPLPAGRFPQQPHFDPNGRWVTYVHDFSAYAYDLSSDRETRLEVPGLADFAPERTTLFHDEFVVVAGREGVLRIFDLRTLRYVAALVRYADSDDWALVGADGRFDATPGAMQKLYFRVGDELVALEQLFSGYYTPGLADEIFNRLPPGSTPPAPNLGSLRPAPGVGITFREATRNLIVEDDAGGDDDEKFIRSRTPEATVLLSGDARGDRISDLRLYRNGKLLADGQRNLIVEDDDGPAPPAGGQRSYRVRLLAGTNHFRAVATNSQGTDSPPAYLTVNYDGDPGAAGGALPPPPGAVAASGPAGQVLHLVTVGIDRYANPTYNLNYATADARAVDETFAARMASLAGNIVHHPIRDDGATRAGILTQLRAVVDGADADDLFVFYFAGHGLVPDRTTGQFYLVPHDVTDPYDATNGLAGRGISATALRDLSAAVSAERQLFVLDACQSGGAVHQLAGHQRGAAEEKAIAGLARNTGTHWLTATDSEQLASEFDALGHGAFTYVLLEGLGGRAAGADSAVTVEELRAYLQRRLPELTQQYTGQPQYPSSYGYGRDFLIGGRRD